MTRDSAQANPIVVTTIADQVREHRARAGVSQAELGRACQPTATASQIGRLELGYEVTASLLARIAAALNVTLEIPPDHPPLLKQSGGTTKAAPKKRRRTR